ncbi:MAG: tetratricopeptide repeat protein [Terriglobia bacterium]
MTLDRMRQNRRLAFVWRIALSLGLLYCVYLVAMRAVAHWYSRHPTPERIQQAIRFDPGNPRYHVALAQLMQYSPEEADAEEIIRLYEKATQLSPYQPSYWAALGGAYELAGRTEDAQRAYERANELFPNSPDMKWRLANFYLRTGKAREALSVLHSILLTNPEFQGQAFDLAWRATRDPDFILEVMIPPSTETLFPYLYYLVEKQQIDAATRVWEQLVALELDFDGAAAFPYLDALIRHKHLEQLRQAWSILGQRNLVRRAQHDGNSNLITNGDFETDILNGGLGWRVTPAEGAVVSVDNRNGFGGIRALQIRFEGKHNLDYRHISQYILVKPNTRYRFHGYMRVQGVTTDSGPRFQVYDAYDPAKLSLATQNLVGSTNWVPQQLEFRAGPHTRLLVVRVARPASRKFDNRITGSVWIDRLCLTALE